jgi:hypothetical protein
MAITSLIIGIVLIVSILSPIFSPLVTPIPMRLIGIIGLILAILALRNNKRPRIAIAGIVLNSLAMLLFIVLLLLLATGN